jgi:hypothetical protein
MEKRYLLHELRLQNNIELDEKKSLDNKSSNIANYSVTFTVLLFGFGSFLLEKIETSLELMFASIATLLIGGVLLSIICVVLSVRAFRLQDYRYVMSDSNFFNDELPPKDIQKWHEHFDTKEIQAWIDDFPNQEDYEDFMIKEYLIALRNNRLANDDKASWIERAQIFFILAICVIPFILLIVLSGVLSGVLVVE